MKKIMFICAMMFVSVQAMNAAEKTASDKVAPKASKECVAEKPEAPSVENCEVVPYRFVTSCGKGITVISDKELSFDETIKELDHYENLLCGKAKVE